MLFRSFESEEEVVALLTRAPSRLSRFPFETAKAAADWLEATLGPEPVTKDGLCPAVKAVKRFPEFLYCDSATLQRKWDALTLSLERGGVGIEFSEQQARVAVLRHPQLLGYAVDTLKRGWLMLTTTEGGLGKSPEEAREAILLFPPVLTKQHDSFVKRVQLLEELGHREALELVSKHLALLSYGEERVRENDAWWKQSGLDYVKLIKSQPNLLGVCSTTELQAKLSFLRRVAGMSKKELNNAASLFAFNLDGRLRPRYFYALLKGTAHRSSTSTVMLETDPSYVAFALGRGKIGRAHV